MVYEFTRVVKLAALLFMKEVPLEQLSAGSFAELVRTRFEVLIDPGHSVSLELTAVTIASPGGAEGVPPGNAMFESFSLLFNGPVDPPLGQRAYRFTHERVGSFDLFIVPVGATRDSCQYEAVFNRRSSPAKSG